MAKNDDKEAIINIYASYNNTVVTLSDLAGNTIGRISGGQVTKHNRLKANPTIGMFIAKRLGDMAKENNIKNFYVKMKGQTGNNVGPGANSIVRTLTKAGFKVISISDVTAIARGGPKKKYGRRGRRV